MTLEKYLLPSAHTQSRARRLNAAAAITRATYKDSFRTNASNSSDPATSGKSESRLTDMMMMTAAAQMQEQEPAFGVQYHDDVSGDERAERCRTEYARWR